MKRQVQGTWYKREKAWVFFAWGQTHVSARNIFGTLTVWTNPYGCPE
ncbi:MAG: hypothetical protein JXB48_03340 [Candidatus Latescibacteria bacterium]|nr:hypothetical protein [Candidatus Latescibacterota bacterium]